jgi:hypothetical protein
MSTPLSTIEKFSILHATASLCALSVEFSVNGNNPSFFRIMLISIVTSIGFLVLLFGTTRILGKDSINNINSTANNTNNKRSEEKFRLVITDLRKSPEGKIQYRLEGTFGNEKWTTWKRYSELRKLARRVPQFKGTFPDKSGALDWVRGADTEVGFVDERRKRLNVFLKSAVPDVKTFEGLISQPGIREILGVPETVKISSNVGLTLKECSVAAIQAVKMTVDCAQYSISDAGGDGWKKYKEQGGVKCFLKTENGNTFAMGRGPMDIDKDTALRFILNMDMRKKWDELFKAQVEVAGFKKFDPNFSYPPEQDPFESGSSQEYEIKSLLLLHTAFSSPTSLVSERDSLTVTTVCRRRKDGAIVIAFKSVEDPRVPEGTGPDGKSGYIRAKVLFAGFVLEDRTDGKPGCMVTTMGVVDPNGAIPAFVVNAVAPQRAFCISVINDAAKKNMGAF